MSVTRVFFLIGLPKTGSTFLQHHVFPMLRKSVFVGAPFTQESPAFNKLQYGDDTVFSPDELKHEVLGIQSCFPGKNVLVSDENLVGLSHINFLNRTTIAKRIASIWPEAEIIIFIRAQRDLVASIYNQFVRSGVYQKTMGPDFISVPGAGLSWRLYTGSKPKWSRELRHIDYQAFMSRNHFDYDLQLTFLKQSFRQVHVFLYEDFLREPARVFGRLSDVLGEDVVWKKLESNATNASLPPEQLLAQLILNRWKHLGVRMSNPAAQSLARLLPHRRVERFQAAIKSHLDHVFDARFLAEVNGRANCNHGLGMERHAEAYGIDAV